ncbi:MAG: DUF1992 domain-containing protein [Desulfovibrionaceae bacterium]|nr:DUF1992 domain-containing protein [Desulfovibrionaceae bacterium]MBR5734904.1 DUF1992 domain-containing protein [Desulfovibrionaceae bacterium]
MDIFALIAEQRIQDAEKEGAFDNLPGKGRPLDLESDAAVPEELRMAYTVLRNAGYVPPEVADRRELDDLLDLLERCPEEREKVSQMRRLEALVFRLNRQGRSLALEANDAYYARVLARVGRIKGRK